MNGRFYYADGRVADEKHLDDRIKRHPIPEEGVIRWFVRTGEVDPDNFAVFRESGVQRNR